MVEESSSKEFPKFKPPPLPDNLTESVGSLDKFDKEFKDKTILSGMLKEWIGQLKPFSEEMCKRDCKYNQHPYQYQYYVECLQNCFFKYEFPAKLREKKLNKHHYEKWRLCVAQHYPEVTWETFFQCERQFSYQKEKDEDDLVEEVYNHCETILRRFNH